MCSGGGKNGQRASGAASLVDSIPAPQNFSRALQEDRHCYAAQLRLPPRSLRTFELTHNSRFCPIRTHSEQFFPHFGGLSGVCLRGGDKQSTALFAFSSSFRGLRGSRRCVRWFSGRLAANSSVIIRHVSSQLPFLEERTVQADGHFVW